MPMLEVLGTGCAKCQLLAERVEAAARGLGLDYQIVKVTELSQILARGVMTTPALVIDGVVAIQGHVPTEKALAQMLKP
jgi:small redox-active disulfide protein 2